MKRQDDAHQAVSSVTSAELFSNTSKSCGEWAYLKPGLPKETLLGAALTPVTEEATLHSEGSHPDLPVLGKLLSGGMEFQERGEHG